MRKICACLGLAAALAVFAAAPALAGDRPYDRHVQALIGLANDQLDAFANRMSAQAKSSKITREGVTTDVSDFLKDMRTDGRNLEQRYGKDAANPTALELLRRAKSAEGFIDRHPGFSGADSEWNDLRSTYAKLAGTYNIDWASDPATWRTTRQTDREITALLGSLDSSVKGATSALGKAAKSAGVEEEARKELDAASSGLRNSTKALKDAFRAKQPVGALVDTVLSGAKALSDQTASLGLADAVSQQWKPVQSSLDKVAMAFGKQ